MAAYSTTITYFMVAWRAAAQVPGPSSGFYSVPEQQPFEYILEVLVFAPVIESLMLIAVLELARRARATAGLQILSAAMLVSALHAWPWWPHAIIVLPAFCVDGASYLYWRSRDSWRAAFVVVASIHALSNFIMAINTLGYLLQKA
jgi:hypothetical protein